MSDVTALGVGVALVFIILLGDVTERCMTPGVAKCGGGCPPVACPDNDVDEETGIDGGNSGV